MLLDRLLHRIGAGAMGLSKAKIVVRRHVEGLSSCASELEVQIAVLGFAIQKGDISPRNPSDRAREAIIKSHFQAAHIKVVKIVVQGCIPIACLKVTVVLFAKPLTKEVADMAEDYEDQVRDIGGEKVIVGGFVHDWVCVFAAYVSTGIAVALVAEGSKLRMLSG